MNGKKKNIFGYGGKKPSQLLFTAVRRTGNNRVWRVRRVTASEVILEKADKPGRGEAEAAGWPWAGGPGRRGVPEGKMYSVTSAMLETEATGQPRTAGGQIAGAGGAGGQSTPGRRRRPR